MRRNKYKIEISKKEILDSIEDIFAEFGFDSKDYRIVCFNSHDAEIRVLSDKFYLFIDNALNKKRLG